MLRCATGWVRHVAMFMRICVAPGPAVIRKINILEGPSIGIPYASLIVFPISSILLAQLGICALRLRVTQRRAIRIARQLSVRKAASLTKRFASMSRG